MIEIVIGAPNPRLQIVQSAIPNSVPGLIGIFIAGGETTEPGATYYSATAGTSRAQSS
jgi:hypothetical protein